MVPISLKMTVTPGRKSSSVANSVPTVWLTEIESKHEIQGSRVECVIKLMHPASRYCLDN